MNSLHVTAILTMSLVPPLSDFLLPSESSAALSSVPLCCFPNIHQPIPDPWRLFLILPVNPGFFLSDDPTLVLAEVLSSDSSVDLPVRSFFPPTERRGRYPSEDPIFFFFPFWISSPDRVPPKSNFHHLFSPHILPDDFSESCRYLNSFLPHNSSPT